MKNTEIVVLGLPTTRNRMARVERIQLWSLCIHHRTCVMTGLLPTVPITDWIYVDCAQYYFVTPTSDTNIF
jgi:hypothetical protein